MKPFEPKILYYESLPSTNTEAIRLAMQGAEEGLCILADEQTAGRGRLQRSWISPKDAGLYLSVLLRPRIPMDRWSILTFMSAVAVTEALQEVCGVRADIKWPNDILAGERKLCGILSEAIETGEGRAVVVGIGINLTRNAFPEELAARAVSVEEITKERPERETVLSQLLQTFSRWYSQLHQPNGPALILDAWIQHSSYAAGKRVRVTNGEEEIQGTTCGLESDGALRLDTERGLRIIRTGDVTNVRVAESGQ